MTEQTTWKTDFAVLGAHRLSYEHFVARNDDLVALRRDHSKQCEPILFRVGDHLRHADELARVVPRHCAVQTVHSTARRSTGSSERNT